MIIGAGIDPNTRKNKVCIARANGLSSEDTVLIKVLHPEGKSGINSVLRLRESTNLYQVVFINNE